MKNPINIKNLFGLSILKIPKNKYLIAMIYLKTLL